MKKVLFAMMVLIMAGITTVNAQWYTGRDTLTNADTLIYTYPNLLTSDWDYQIQFQADSLSGTTAGTILLQAQSCRNCSDWVTISTDTLISGGNTAYMLSGQLKGIKQRLYLTTTGTQSTTTRAWFNYKRRHN